MHKPNTPEYFIDGLQAVHDGRVRSLPNFSDTLNHTGKIPIDTSRYRRMAGLYMKDEVQQQWGGDPCGVDDIGFTPKPFRGLGRDDSRQGVFFGDLELSTTNGEVVLPVAVKPFMPKDFHHATQEAGILEYIDSKGIPALRVLGMVALPNDGIPQSYLITKEEPGVTTLDNTEWESMHQTERWRRLLPAADTLAALHSEAVFHGDFEFRNVSVTENGRSIFVVDVEYSVSLRDALTPYSAALHETRALAQKVSADFSALTKSIRAHVTPRGTADKKIFDCMVESVYEPYFAGIDQAESAYQSVLTRAFKQVITNKRQQACGDW